MILLYVATTLCDFQLFNAVRPSLLNLEIYGDLGSSTCVDVLRFLLKASYLKLYLVPQVQDIELVAFIYGCPSQ